MNSNAGGRRRIDETWRRRRRGDNRPVQRGLHHPPDVGAPLADDGAGKQHPPRVPAGPRRNRSGCRTRRLSEHGVDERRTSPARSRARRLIRGREGTTAGARRRLRQGPRNATNHASVVHRRPRRRSGLDGESVGVIGEIHPKVLVEHDLELPVAASSSGWPRWHQSADTANALAQASSLGYTDSSSRLWRVSSSSVSTTISMRAC